MSDKSKREVPQIIKLPSIGKYQSERPSTPQPHQFRSGRLSQNVETTGQYSSRFDDLVIDCDEAGHSRRLRPLSRVGGRKLGRSREEELKKRDRERLAAILKKGNPEWLANSKSETSLFKVPKRSQQILQELSSDGFVTTHSVGGLAFDVSLGGRPVRLSPIGKRLKRKKTHRKKSSKRKKREKREKLKKTDKMSSGADREHCRARGSRYRLDEDGDDKDEYEDDDWEDYDVELKE